GREMHGRTRIAARHGVACLGETLGAARIGLDVPLLRLAHRRCEILIYAQGCRGHANSSCCNCYGSIAIFTASSETPAAAATFRVMLAIILAKALIPRQPLNECPIFWRRRYALSSTGTGAELTIFSVVRPKPNSFPIALP